MTSNLHCPICPQLFTASTHRLAAAWCVGSTCTIETGLYECRLSALAIAPAVDRYGRLLRFALRLGPAPMATDGMAIRSTLLQSV